MIELIGVFPALTQTDGGDDTVPNARGRVEEL